MAQYTFREIENRPGLVFDPARKKNLYAEDIRFIQQYINELEARITALEPPIPVSNLVFRLKLNDNLSSVAVIDDISELACEAQRNTSLLSSAGVSSETGGDHGALAFNGSSDYVSIPSSEIFDCDTFSISLWVKFNQNSTCVSMFDRIYTDGSGHTLGIRRRLTDNKIFFFLNTGSGVNLYADSATSPDTWYHVVVTYDGSNMRMYINAVLQSSTPAQSGSFVSTKSIGLGRAGDSSEYLNGYLDEVRFYKDTVLDQAGVDTLYNSGDGTEEI